MSRLATIGLVGTAAGILVKFVDQPNEVCFVVAIAVALAASSLSSVIFPTGKKNNKKQQVDDSSDEEAEAQTEPEEQTTKPKKKKTRSRASAKRARRAAARVIREAEEEKAEALRLIEEKKAAEEAARNEEEGKSSKNKKKRKKKKKKGGEQDVAKLDDDVAEEKEVAPEMEWQTQQVKLTKNQKMARARAAMVDELGEQEDLTAAATQVDLQVDKRHYSTLIGRGGEMLRSIREATGAEIMLPKKGSLHEIVVITGTKEECALAKKTILDIIRDGYSALTHPNTTKNQIDVPIKLHPRIVGRAGTTIRALQSKTGTTINLPDRESRSKTVTIVGEAEGVLIAKQAIRDLVEKGYSDLTHDNWDSIEIPFSQDLLPSLIGKGGETIKALQKRYNVDISTPDKDDTRNFVTVQGPVDQIALAVEEIRTLGVVEEVPMDTPWQGAAAGHDLSSLNSWD